jgi:uncharacterized membrane protein
MRQNMGLKIMSLTRRLLLAASLATGLASLTTAASAQVKEIKIDFATYNPVSLVGEGVREGWHRHPVGADLGL